MTTVRTGRPAAVVVSHDTREDALRCLATLPAAGAGETVLVDSGSRDGTARAVRDRYPHVRVLELNNVGFARAANAGMRVTSSPVVAVANADVTFAPGALTVLARKLRADPSLAAVGPQVTYPGGAPQASARRRPDLRTAVGHAALGRVLPGNRYTRRYHDLDADPGARRDVDWLSGCALALRRDAIEDVGGFDPGYFLYVEDVDLGVRLRQAGWRLGYEPTARVVHRVGASTSRRRGRSLVSHARSLERYHRLRCGDGLLARAARPLVRVALALWVLVTWSAERAGGRGRSSTGERVAPAGAEGRT